MKEKTEGVRTMDENEEILREIQKHKQEKKKMYEKFQPQTKEGRKPKLERKGRTTKFRWNGNFSDEEDGWR